MRSLLNCENRNQFFFFLMRNSVGLTMKLRWCPSPLWSSGLTHVQTLEVTLNWECACIPCNTCLPFGHSCFLKYYVHHFPTLQNIPISRTDTIFMKEKCNVIGICCFICVLLCFCIWYLGNYMNVRCQHSDSKWSNEFANIEFLLPFWNWDQIVVDHIFFVSSWSINCNLILWLTCNFKACVCCLPWLEFLSVIWKLKSLILVNYILFVFVYVDNCGLSCCAVCVGPV